MHVKKGIFNRQLPRAQQYFKCVRFQPTFQPSSSTQLIKVSLDGTQYSSYVHKTESDISHLMLSCISSGIRQADCRFQILLSSWMAGGFANFTWNSLNINTLYWLQRLWFILFISSTHTLPLIISFITISNFSRWASLVWLWINTKINFSFIFQEQNGTNARYTWPPSLSPWVITSVQHWDCTNSENFY